MSEQPNWRENLNKEWCKDIGTMTQTEISDVLGLFFYQCFLVEIDRIKFSTDLSSGGNYVKFEIEGEAYRDSDNISNINSNEELDEEDED
jgi:hypothetical protein